MEKDYFQSKLWIALLLLATVVSSCSSDSYINVIPDNSTAVISIDTEKITNDKGNASTALAGLSSFIGVSDVTDCGIDLKSKLYIFETADGNICMTAKIADEDKLEETLENAAKTGKCQKLSKRKDYKFTVIQGAWIAGFSSDALLIAGPILPAQQAEVRQQMVKMLGADDDNSIKGTPIFDRLDSIESPVAMVAQASALPDKFVAPFTLGAPKGTDPSQILIAANLESSSDGCLTIKGKTFSLNKNIDDELKKSLKILRPIKGLYLKTMPEDAALGAFLNVDGKQFINLLHNNATFQALLAGMNTAIDIDKIIKSVDGDLTFILPTFSEDKTIVQMAAQLATTGFLDDVNYWKQSCPSGSKIVDWGDNAYHFTDGKNNLYFGVTADKQFYSGGTPEAARTSITSVTHPLPASILKNIKGQRLCMLLNMKSLFGDDGTGARIVSQILTPLFGKVNTIIYSVY